MVHAGRRTLAFGGAPVEEADKAAVAATDAELLELLTEEYRKPIQADIARSARLRRTPEVVFAFDPAIRTGARIEEILTSLDLSDDEGPAITGPASDGETPGADDGGTP